jgi:hypothetical protein
MPDPIRPKLRTALLFIVATLPAHAAASVQMYGRLGGADGMTDFERGQLDALRAHAEGFVESDSSRAVLFGKEADARAPSSRTRRSPASRRRRGGRT